MVNAKIRNLLSWNEFHSVIESIDSDASCDENSPGFISDLLFRGHENSDWLLESTLDRFLSRTRSQKQTISTEDYYRIILAVYPAFASYTGLRFELPQPDTQEYDSAFKRMPGQIPGYSFVIHLRHHGFPSPLLDWSRSPYVAAFFAFNGASQGQQVSIYCFREHAGKSKGGWSNQPRINGHGPYAITHDRHYRQQAEYTTCTIGEKHNLQYVRHEDVNFGEDQDILYKMNIPSSERDKVMKNLEQMNINAFSLFGNQEGLANMLAYREIECGI